MSGTQTHINKLQDYRFYSVGQNLFEVSKIKFFVFVSDLLTINKI